MDYRQFETSGQHNLEEIKPKAIIKGTSLFSITSSYLLNTYLIEHENSVDCIAANPHTHAEFVTGSHDKTIKVWDV